MKLEFYRQIFEKLLNIRCYKNLSSGVRVAHGDGGADGDDESTSSSSFYTFCERVWIDYKHILVNTYKIHPLGGHYIFPIILISSSRNSKYYLWKNHDCSRLRTLIIQLHFTLIRQKPKIKSET
jgi:hypothetical protein